MMLVWIKEYLFYLAQCHMVEWSGSMTEHPIIDRSKIRVHECLKLEK
jgi:hypothetical protein